MNMADLDCKPKEFYKQNIDLAWSDFMLLALKEAESSAALGEVPVGALLVDARGEVLATAGNRSIIHCDPSAHAEILALRKAAKQVGNHRLPGTIMVTTLEPCIMCLGCLVQARIAGIIFACRDPKSGAVISKLQANQDLGWLNHGFWFAEGLMQDKSLGLMQNFFRQRRKKLRRGTEVRS